MTIRSDWPANVGASALDREHKRERGVAELGRAYGAADQPEILHFLRDGERRAAVGRLPVDRNVRVREQLRRPIEIAVLAAEDQRTGAGGVIVVRVNVRQGARAPGGPGAASLPGG